MVFGYSAMKKPAALMAADKFKAGASMSLGAQGPSRHARAALLLAAAIKQLFHGSRLAPK